jgi:hypothetical protein
MSCVLSTFGLTRESLWLLGGNRHVAPGADGTVAEVVVLEERLSLHFLPVGWLEVLDMQSKRVRAQDLIAAQYGRVTDDIDAVKFRLNDGVVNRGADLGLVAEHEGETVAAVVQAI